MIVNFSHILNEHELWNHKFEGNLFTQVCFLFSYSLSHNTDLNVHQEKFRAELIAFQIQSSSTLLLKSVYQEKYVLESFIYISLLACLNTAKKGALLFTVVEYYEKQNKFIPMTIDSKLTCNALLESSG